MVFRLKMFYTFSAVVFCAGLLVQCGRQRVQWQYIVPDGYQGYLAVRYDCPGGQPLMRSSDTITVVFTADGTFCTSDEYSASTGPLATAQTTSGQPIPYVLDPKQHQGYAMCCGSTRVIGGDTLENPGTELVLSLRWVGEMHPRPRHEPDILEDIHAFLQDRFGLRDVRE